MKKYVSEMEVVENSMLHSHYCLLKLRSSNPLPEMTPGQFVQVLVDKSPNTFLRRPISINFVDYQHNELWLLIQLVGDGTKRMAEFKVGESVNIVYPLGNGFSIPGESDSDKRFLLVGGGVGRAPLLYLGKRLKDLGFQPCFLLGARSAGDLLQLEQFRAQGEVFVTTEDGSAGEKGFVTNHSVLKERNFDRIYSCGPKPMMIAVARFAASKGIDCEVSLENKMACGVGACLCCVEKNKEGHNVCVCTEGPVFNSKELTWLN